ncbi:unnamed protein product [Brugia pahangi]|uniref:Sushi domain-containing protein n=1 Tax=Brugia pahangi TaxID=6280 RepID=A0A0N4TQL3_BRUPA|nr:unnamed protein product [Brugia pahangi]
MDGTSSNLIRRFSSCGIYYSKTICTASTKAWLPDVQDCDDGTDKCTLKLKPDVETQLEKLLWFAWNAASGIRFVKISFTDDIYDTFEHLYAHCDQPLTLRLSSQKSVKEVQIRTNNPFVSIDAVQFVSFPLNFLCSHCLPYHYRIYRTPAFQKVKEGVTYTYSVAVESAGIEGLHSASTIYSYDMNVCGDGKRSKDEQCDDGNLNDSDGWRSSGWVTCSQLAEAGEISLHASFTGEIFPISILIGFEIVLSTESKPVLSIIGVNLQYAKKTTISMEEQGILSCAQNPLEIAIPYTLVDRLSNVEAIHLHVSNASRIVVTAVILQSSKMFNLLALQNCTVENKYFDPVSASCVAKDCRSLSIGSCTPLNIPRSWVRFYFVTNYIICEENGLWTLPEAFCQVVCSQEGLLALNISYDSINCKVKRIYDMQTSYPVSTIGPSCVLVTCPSPKIVYIGSYNCTNGFEIGPSYRFQCPGIAQHRYSVCKKDGAWSNRFQCSSPQTACLSPPSMRNIQFTCPRRLYPVLEETQTLPSGENLLVLRTVHNISCTISSTFYPQVDALSCVRSCNREFMDDGWCDFQNNRGYCDWNGGDCCASTVRGGCVRLMFPSLCTSFLCQCIDPFGAENMASISDAGSSNNALHEHKSTIKRTIRYGRHHSITEPMSYPVVDASLNTFTISLADAAFLLRNDVYLDSEIQINTSNVTINQKVCHQREPRTGRQLSSFWKMP